jgi:hypothetical protein
MEPRWSQAVPAKPYERLSFQLYPDSPRFCGKDEWRPGLSARRLLGEFAAERRQRHCHNVAGVESKPARNPSETVEKVPEKGGGCGRFGVLTSGPLKLTRFRGARQAFNGGFSDAQDASALFT